MNNIAIDADKVKRSPEIIFNAEQGLLSIKGRSMPENPKTFYDPLITWVGDYVQITNNKETKVIINLEYYNTSSSLYILDILRVLDKLAAKENVEVILEWYLDVDSDDTWADVFEDKLSPFVKNIIYRVVK